MVAYKLTYFNGRGAAETIRQVFAVAGEKFEDIRIEKEDWPKHKAEAPFGQVPFLEVDGHKLPQSVAILRFVARKFGLSGKTPFEEAWVDAVADQIKDFMTEIRPFIAVLGGHVQGDLAKLTKEVLEPACQKHFVIFTKLLKDNNSGYLVGSHLTFVDLALAEIVAQAYEKTPTDFDHWPELVAHSKKVRSNPNLKHWIETRPVTAF